MDYETVAKQQRIINTLNSWDTFVIKVWAENKHPAKVREDLYRQLMEVSGGNERPSNNQ